MDGNGISMSWIFAIIIILIICGGGSLFGLGGNNANNDINSLRSEMNQGFNNQQLQQIALSSANNNYETAKLIADQSMLMTTQNNTNLTNAIQGFNTVNQNIITQGNAIQQAICDLGYKMETCCCSIKTQMLEDRLADANARLVEKNAEISNFQQSQYILNSLGRFVAYPPAAAAVVTNTGT
jgi:hypothetical protein